MRLPQALFFLCVFFTGSFLSGQSAQEMLENVDSTLEPEQYHAVMELTTTRPDRQISVTLDILYKKNVGSFLEILAPARVRGTRFLQKSQGLWIFSPQSEDSRPLRLSPELSFQGSVFSNGDMSEPHYSRDYHAEWAGTESLTVKGLGTISTLMLIATPKTQKAQYGQMKLWIEKGTALPIKIEYTAKSGLLFKKMEFFHFKKLAGKLRPSVYSMVSYEDPSIISTLKILSMEQTNFSDQHFSILALTR